MNLKKHTIVPVSLWNRFCYGVFDSFVFSLNYTIFILAINIIPPNLPIKYYSENDYISYITTISVFIFILFLTSIIRHRFFGVTIGKSISGYKTTQLDGTPLTWMQSTIRSIALYGAGILIFAPTPLLKIISHSITMHEKPIIPPDMSIMLSFIGFIFWLLCVVTVEGNRSLLETALGIVTGRKDSTHESSFTP